VDEAGARAAARVDGRHRAPHRPLDSPAEFARDLVERRHIRHAIVVLAA